MRTHRDELLEKVENVANEVTNVIDKLVGLGNGQIHYVDRYSQAKRLFQNGLTGTPEVIARDVKVEVEFSPQAVTNHRMLGYENRALAADHFRDDKVDTGEVGAGHSVTALYEVELTQAAPVENLAVVRVRWKSPDGAAASEKEASFGRSVLRQDLLGASPDLRFAVALAGAADILRRAPQGKSFSLSTALELAAGATEERPEREEAVTLLRRAKELLLAAEARTVRTDGF